MVLGGGCSRGCDAGVSRGECEQLEELGVEANAARHGRGEMQSDGVIEEGEELARHR